MPDLRVGLAFCQDRLEEWQSRIAAQIAAEPGMGVVALLRMTGAEGAAFRGPRRCTAFLPAEVNPHAPVIGLDANDRPALDVIINLTSAPAKAAGARVWSFRFADPREPGRHEVRRRLPTTSVELVNHAGENIGCIRRKTARSHRRNADALLLDTACLVLRALRALAARAPLESLSVPLGPAPAAASPMDRIRESIRKRTMRADWTIGFLPISIEDLIRARAPGRPVWLSGLPRDLFFADPFPLEVTADRISLLAEEGVAAPPYKGKITQIDADLSGAVLQRRDAVVAAEHLSFPFTLMIDGKPAFAPECHEGQALRLYQRDGDDWRRCGDILPGGAWVDPVLHRTPDGWWLFCTDRAHEDTTHLYIFHAPDLNGPWTPHLLNPVKSDVCGARPAGALVSVDGALYRPAQDCSIRYGGAVAIQRVTRLTATEFAEEPVFQLMPEMLGPDFIGVHTLNGAGGVTLIDGLRLERGAPGR